MNISEITTPAYVCERSKLIKNLELLQFVSQNSGAKVLCALKGFAFSLGLDLVDSYLFGATCSGLGEAKFAKKHFSGEIHTYSPAFKESEIDEILGISNHIVFNSFNQWSKFRQKVHESRVSAGIRINPEVSFSPTDEYNPCGKFSRLGVTAENFMREFSDLKGIEGLHFHALCEESSESLAAVLAAVEAKFGEILPKMKWVNFGGGHHITRKGYNVELLIDLIRKFREKYGVEVYIEPGEAVGWQTGYLVASVLDIVENGAKIAILDTSAEAHMPDTVLMPYRPEVRNEAEKGEFVYRLGGNTCLAGDIIGLKTNPEFRFSEPLKIGDRVIFEDQIHYTIVKNTTFNGIKLPDLYLIDDDGEILKSKKFGYDEYDRRN